MTKRQRQAGDICKRSQWLASASASLAIISYRKIMKASQCNENGWQLIYRSWHQQLSAAMKAAGSSGRISIRKYVTKEKPANQQYRKLAVISGEWRAAGSREKRRRKGWKPAWRSLTMKRLVKVIERRNIEENRSWRSEMKPKEGEIWRKSLWAKAKRMKKGGESQKSGKLTENWRNNRRIGEAVAAWKYQ